MPALLFFIVVFVFLVLAFLPLAQLVLTDPPAWLLSDLWSFVGTIGWAGAILLLIERRLMRGGLDKSARSLGIDTRFSSLNSVVSQMLSDMKRKDASLSIDLVERRITSREELSRTLERVVALSYNLLRSESAELALFDSESGLYHSSFVLGKPFRTSAQAMLSGASRGEPCSPSPEVLIVPIAFAGSVLGSLRIALPRGAVPSDGDREIMRILALQSGLAIINAQYTEQLVKMKMASEESVKAKTGFLANLSHEIRGPLGIMLNGVELVLDGLCGKISADQSDILRMVRSNGEHLLELINDVLDYAKVESGKLSPNKSNILVNDLLKDMRNVIRTQAESKGHQVSYRENEEVLSISCDKRHLRQMLINLLTNAVKYTPDGGKIEIWGERAPGGKVKISVQDNGIGIEEQFRQQVFSPFERVDNSYAITQAGAGLGLSLTKRLCEVNGGTIDFKSVAGEGSVFWLLFPAVRYDRTAVEEESEVINEVKGNGEVVLVVESDENERNMIVRYLRHLGFVVMTASGQLEALNILKQGNVELAMVDNKMVDRPDADLVQVLRDSAGSARFPIILMTSRAFIFDIEKYLKSGIDLCLVKPVELKKLGAICRQMIDGEFDQELECVKGGRTRSQLVKRNTSPGLVH